MRRNGLNPRTLVRWTRLVPIGLALGLHLGAAGCSPQDAALQVPAPPPAEKLVVITPHNPMIRELFGMGFCDWHQQLYGRSVDIQWIPQGTVECLSYIERVATQADAAAGRRAPDVLFGGGITDHAFLVDRGLARPVNLGDVLEGVPETIMNLATRDSDGRWCATALSGFGILYHKRGCVERGIPEPTTWTDLAKPEYFGWVSMADPTRSGSTRQCLTFILQKHGWREGWGIILRTAANCRALLHDSSDVISDVSAGVGLAGLSVNFSALHEIEMQGADRLAYVNPPRASALTPDLITVLSVATHPELAERFVRFCLSEQGQVLWGVKSEERQGYRDTLYRYPVNATIYEKYAGKLWATDNPLTMQAEMPIDLALQQKQAQIVAPLLLAACGDNHIRLQTCWKRIVDSGLPAKALTELLEPPFDEQTAYELGAKYSSAGPESSTLLGEWSRAFRDKYERVLAALAS